MSSFSHVRRGFAENLRFALLAVRAHKLRAGLTILGIVVGVATVIAMVSIVTGFNRNIAQGRFLTESDVEHAADVLVIGDDVREKLFPREDPLNKRIQLGHDSYLIVGVFEKKGQMFGESQDSFVVIPLTTFDRRFPWIKVGGSNGDALRILTVPYRPDQVGDAIDKARAVLRLRRHVRFNQPDDFGIVTPDKMLESFQGITNGIALVMIFVA